MDLDAPGRLDELLGSVGRCRDERVLDCPPSRDVFDDEPAEVSCPIDDRDLFDRRRRFLPGPSRLTCSSVAVEARAAGRDPVVQAFAGLGEVLVPAEGSGAMLFFVVCS